MGVRFTFIVVGTLTFGTAACINVSQVSHFGKLIPVADESYSPRFLWSQGGHRLASREGEAAVSSSEIFLRDGTISPATDGFWRAPIPPQAEYEAANLDAEGVLFDINYNVIVSNRDPWTDVYVPASWERRVGGTQWLTQVRFPVDFTVPDAGLNNTPNNPLCTINRDTLHTDCFNSFTRPYPGSNIYAYNAGSHGGSGLSGGDITAAALRSGRIEHAIGVLVWAKNHLSFHDGGFTTPAVRADGYADPETYGGENINLVMGARLALHPEVMPESLEISCPQVFPIIEALKQYGAYVVDDSAWDRFYLSADSEAAEMLAPCENDLLKVFQALQAVILPN